MRTEQDCKGGNASIVDRMIGNSYDVVKYVARYLKEIRYVAFNMEHIYRISQELRSNIKLKETITALDTTYTIPLPSKVSPQKVLASHVLVTTIDGEIYPEASNTFSWVIKNGLLHVKVSDVAPQSFLGSEIRWFLTWESSASAGE